MIKRFLLVSACMLFIKANSQMIDTRDIPNFKYTRKSFLVKEDTIKFKNILTTNQGLTKVYETISLGFFDLDDSKKYVVNVTQELLACIEGNYVNNKRAGIFIHSIMDSLNPQIRYKVWEQNYKNGKKHGMSKAYTLQGKIAAQYEYKEDSLVGKSILFAADGKNMVEEIIYDILPGKYTVRKYNDTSGKLIREEKYEKYELNGKARDFYSSGQVEMEEFYIDGKLNGTRRHFYPSGARWNEVEYRNGKTWTALGAYLENGKPIYPGTLINGTGVLHIYNKYGELQESYMFMKGEFVK